MDWDNSWDIHYLKRGCNHNQDKCCLDNRHMMLWQMLDGKMSLDNLSKVNDGCTNRGVGVGGRVKVWINANSAQPPRLKLDWAGLSLATLYNFDKGNSIIVTLVFWEYKLYDLSVPWNIWRFVHNDIQIFEPKIFEYSSQKYSNIWAKNIRIFVFGPL